MTAEKFGELAADLWRARQRFDRAAKNIAKHGLVIKQRGKLAANPSSAKCAAAGREVERLAALLAA
jgi:hypothetical protein